LNDHSYPILLSLCLDFSESEESVAFLLRKGAGVNGQSSKNGETPLHIAIKYQGYDLFKLLIKYGADLDMEDDNGVSPRDLLGDLEKEVKLEDHIWNFLKDVREKEKITW
jgi:ankyrin repeat protein